MISLMPIKASHLQSWFLTTSISYPLSKVDTTRQGKANGVGDCSADKVSSSQPVGQQYPAQSDENGDKQPHGQESETTKIPLDSENGAKKVESMEETEKDVFSGISDSEDVFDGDSGLSREQRSFARYESPRGTEGQIDDKNVSENADPSAKSVVNPPNSNSTTSSVS